MADIKVEGNNLNENHPVKKRKLDDAVKEKQADVHSNIEDLSSFKLEKILNNNTRSKIVCLQGTFSDADGAGLVILEKSAFEEENLKCNSEYFSTSSHLKKVFHNDIYGNYEYYPVSQLNCKYFIFFVNPYIVDETPDIYESAVLPFIIKEQFDLQWVYNILEHKCEADRIVFEDPDPVNGFLLLPDLKWNGTTLDTLYLLAIVNDRHIKSLRDLRESIFIAKNIFNKGCKTIEEKYGIAKSQLLIYLHYQPSFYHLHVHFTYLKHEAPGILAERAHLLSNVISNIELVADYYKKVTIPFVVRETDKLFKVLEEKDILKKSCLKV
ncbi:histidine triad hit protein member [Holotrichia oblita]|uniref:Histidine triad hit protein member n=1 Tax=Holotrichia oblita TaxID=644536 RepID=A0ACB9TSM9_HOLOL|nr:histidine triad hit protein member [Holotrichia oblita]